MLVWIHVVLHMSLFITCLANGLSVFSDFNVMKNVYASADVLLKCTVRSRIRCAAQCRQHPDCVVASYNRAARECFLHKPGDTTHTEDNNWDILWWKDQCKENWLQFTSSCYYFSQDKKSWASAQEECKKKNANLVKINDALENSWMYSIIKDIHQWGTWIGATDIKNEGHWVWVSDNTSAKYTAWSNEGPQPDNLGGGQHCAKQNAWFNSIQRHIKYFWDDSNCVYQAYYVCEAAHLANVTA